VRFLEPVRRVIAQLARGLDRVVQDLEKVLLDEFDPAVFRVASCPMTSSRSLKPGGGAPDAALPHKAPTILKTMSGRRTMGSGFRCTAGKNNYHVVFERVRGFLAPASAAAVCGVRGDRPLRARSSITAAADPYKLFNFSISGRVQPETGAIVRLPLIRLEYCRRLVRQRCVRRPATGLQRS